MQNRKFMWHCDLLDSAHTVKICRKIVAKLDKRTDDDGTVRTYQPIVIRHL